MANQEAKLKVAELDFDTIKSNLKTFLKSQSEFSDYNFEGSGLSVLLDILAYNTHYMAYYLNMTANEMFMDTALLRSSVVSHAKLLGYTPRSRAAAQATINLSFGVISGDANSTITLPRFSRFVSGQKDGVSYVFVNTEQKTVSKNSAGGFFFEDLKIKEGQPQSYSFVYDATNNVKQIFELPDAGIDTSTLRVQVQTSSQNSSKETYTLAEDATEVTSTSKVFYLEENRNGKYQIYFGNNIVGKSLTDGNIVIVTYLVSNGLDANGIKTFKLIDNLSGYSATATLVSESASGNLEEGIDDIRLSAPKSFIAQNRAVTKNDYITLINRDYPYFSAVTVWGGEDNDPPIYGKVFFSVKPTSNYQITDTEIEYVANKVIKPLSVVTVQPEYVAPDYNYINLQVDVAYDPTLTSKTEGQIETLVRNAILSYSEANLNSFDNTLKVSKLMREIDNADTSIQNNDVEVTLEKRFRPVLNKAKDYVIDFGVPLSPGNSLKRLFCQPSFQTYDLSGVLRDAFIEEIPQSFTGITEIDITNPGSGYTELPTITLLGDGRGAELEPVLINGRLRSIKVLKSGIDYTTAAITISGGGGSGATAVPVLQAKSGKLRVYYYDDNKIKKSINEEAGIVEYDTGIVRIVNLKPVQVQDAFGTMVVKAYPKNSVFTVGKNKILALDSTDPESIKINVSAVVP